MTDEQIIDHTTRALTKIIEPTQDLLGNLLAARAAIAGVDPEAALPFLTNVAKALDDLKTNGSEAFRELKSAVAEGAV